MDRIMENLNMENMYEEQMRSDIKADIRAEYGNKWPKAWTEMRGADQEDSAVRYLESLAEKRRRTLAGWMERHPAIWIFVAVVTGIGLAVCHIMWGVR